MKNNIGHKLTFRRQEVKKRFNIQSQSKQKTNNKNNRLKSLKTSALYTPQKPLLSKKKDINSQSLDKKNMYISKQKTKESTNQDYFPFWVQTSKKQTQFQIIPKSNQNILPNLQSSSTLNTQFQINQFQKFRRPQISFSSNQFFKKSVFFKQKQKNNFLYATNNARSPSILRNSSNKKSNVSQTYSQKSSSIVSNSQFKCKAKHGCENTSNNNIKKRYQSILSQLKQNEKQIINDKSQQRKSINIFSMNKKVNILKYHDELFPATQSSIFSMKKQQNKPKNITWIRLSEYFKGKYISVGKMTKQIQVIRNQDSLSSQFIIESFNALKNCAGLINVMFENQNYCEHGIYLVKIYQQSTWKYVIIDDFIPVYQKNGLKYPAFITVRFKNQQKVDIWPFLLEKAYASYYYSYVNLNKSNFIDFAEELTGSVAVKYKIKYEQKQKNQIDQILNSVKFGIQNIIIGCKQKQGMQINYKTLNNQLNSSISVYSKQIKQYNFSQQYDFILVITPFRNNITTSIKKQKNAKQDQNKLSVRSFKLNSKGEFTLCIRQKDRKFFPIETYKYNWCRVLLFQKQYTNDYRMIDGIYENKKIINLNNQLQPGQYIAIIQIQWQNDTNKQIIFQLYGDNSNDFKRQQYDCKIIQKGCADLAQRYGKLKQINKNICTYNYVWNNTGMIIQNIINERVSGPVVVIRSLKGLNSTFQIIPVNKQFYIFNGNKLIKKEDIQIQIQKGQQFTVVLKLKGGKDLFFLNSFDFGC